MRISSDTRRRFEAKFERGPEDECWNWLASLNYHGYGQFKYNGKTVLAHVIAHRLYIGPVRRLDVHHTCENRRCVNPAHLEAKTRSEHTRGHNPHPTHCTRGHRRTPENVLKDGWCRICRNARKRELYRLKKGNMP